MKEPEARARRMTILELADEALERELSLAAKKKEWTIEKTREAWRKAQQIPLHPRNEIGLLRDEIAISPIIELLMCDPDHTLTTKSIIDPDWLIAQAKQRKIRINKDRLFMAVGRLVTKLDAMHAALAN